MESTPPVYSKAPVVSTPVTFNSERNIQAIDATTRSDDSFSDLQATQHFEFGMTGTSNLAAAGYTVYMLVRKVEIESTPLDNIQNQYRLMSNANSLPPIQYLPENRQLDGVSNFLAFSDSIVSTAHGYGLELGYLNGSIPRPPANVAPAVLATGPNPGQNNNPTANAALAAPAVAGSSSQPTTPSVFATMFDLGTDLGDIEGKLIPF
ncbi:hypothetical protein C8R42DRAFT_641119 [Lentinula raphanica]|nr:hypothetical protein C8R42DRAFT_641119 [Lentinula raphanica]